MIWCCIFSYAYLPCVHLIWWGVFSGLLSWPDFRLFVFLWLSFKSFCIFWIPVLCQLWLLQRFSLSLWLVFSFFWPCSALFSLPMCPADPLLLFSELLGSPTNCGGARLPTEMGEPVSTIHFQPTYIYIHSLKHLHCARHCSKSQECISEQKRKGSESFRAHSLVGKTYTEEYT